MQWWYWRMREAVSNDDPGWVCVTGGSVLFPTLRLEEGVGRIALSPEVVLGVDRTRRLDPFSQLALVAVEFARNEAGLKPWDRQHKVISDGVAVGSALGAVTTTVRYAKRLIAAGPSSTNPIDFPDSVDGAAAGHVAMDLGLGGPSITFTDGATSGVAALVYAARQIVWGRATRMHVVVGDRFDAFFAQALADDPMLHAVCPCECVMALVLEARPSHPLADDSIALSGFLPAVRGGRGPNSDVLPERFEAGVEWQFDANGAVQYGTGDVARQKILMNPSGALEIASAWTKVCGARTSLIGAGAIVTLPRAPVHFGGPSYPNLAFV